MLAEDSFLVNVGEALKKRDPLKEENYRQLKNI